MDAIVKRWGNSAAVRLPTAVMEAAHLRLDQWVAIRVEDGRIIIEPIADEPFDLAILLAGITDENLHELTETGEAAGGEALIG